RLLRRDSALALLHAIAKAAAGVDANRGLGFRDRDRQRAARPDHWILAVLAVQTVSSSVASVACSLYRAKAPAHDPRARLRILRVHLGVQRDALDGSFPGRVLYV